jgi:hypothetical protein
MRKPSTGMNRREFLKKAGIGSIALASLPAFANALATPALADGQTNFHFTAVSLGPSGPNLLHTLVMAGDGKINPAQVEGGGSFNHVNNAASLPFPKPLLASGTWKAKRLVSWNPIGTYGLFAAGVLEMEVDLVREIPSPAVIPATLEVVCNIPFVPLLTGKHEGFTLTVDGLQFTPQVPPVGVTLFTLSVEQRN